MYRTVVVVVALALGSMSACTSIPSAQRVALDAVETLDVDESVKQCMRDIINDYTEDELQEIGDLAVEGNADAVTQLGFFEGRLAACSTPGDG